MDEISELEFTRAIKSTDLSQSEREQCLKTFLADGATVGFQLAQSLKNRRRIEAEISVSTGWLYA